MKRNIIVLLGLLCSILVSVCFPSSVSAYTEKELRELGQMNPFPLESCVSAGVNGWGCPQIDYADEVLRDKWSPEGQQCSTPDTFFEDPYNNHLWVKDQEITNQGKENERARQFIYWVMNTVSFDTHSIVLKQIWALSRNIAYVLLILVVAIIGLGIIIGQRGDFSFQVQIWPSLLKVGLLLVYITFSATIVLLLIQISEVLMKFFIENLGGEHLFNIYFSDNSNERSYITWIGCRDLNIRVQESVNAQLFLLDLTNVTYYVMGVMLLLRKIILWFMLFVSPFLALLIPFVFIRNVGWIWIGVFFQWLFYGPLFALFLGAMAMIWQLGIPFYFIMSRAGNMSGYVFPTGTNILYGGPFQNNRLSPLNSSSMVDTFAEYVITLVMMWAVILFPWWLLRIFRDYCCDGIIAAKNILMAMYDQMRANKPPPGGTTIKQTTEHMQKARPTNVSRDVEVSVKTKLGSLNEIRSVETTSIPQALNLAMPKLVDIARMETNKESLSNVKQNLSALSNPVQAQTPTERQQYMNVRTELFSRAIKKDGIARQILSSVSTNKQEMMHGRTQILQSIPQANTITNVISMTSQLPQQKVESITTKLVEHVSKNDQAMQSIAQSASAVASTQVSPKQVSSILTSYQNNMSQPMGSVVTNIAKETNTSKEVVKAVLSSTSDRITSKNTVEKVMKEQKIEKETIKEAFDKIPTNISVHSDPVQVSLSQQSTLPVAQTQQVMNSLLSTAAQDKTFIGNINTATGYSPSTIQTVMTTYANNTDKSNEDVMTMFGQDSDLPPDGGSKIMIEVNKELGKSEELLKQVAEKSKIDLKEVKKIAKGMVEVSDSPVTPIQKKQSMVSAVVSQTAIQEADITQVVRAIFNAVLGDKTMMETIQQQTQADIQSIHTVIGVYFQNMNQMPEDIGEAITETTQISADIVQSIIRHISAQATKDIDVIESIATSTNATNEQIKAIVLHLPETIAFKSPQKDTTTPVITRITGETKLSKEKVAQILETAKDTILKDVSHLGKIAKEANVEHEQIKTILESYAVNVNQSQAIVTENIQNQTKLNQTQVESTINVIQAYLIGSEEVLKDISTKTEVASDDVKAIFTAMHIESTPGETTDTMDASSQEVVGKVIEILAKDETFVAHLQEETELQEIQVKTMLSTYAQHMNEPFPQIVQHINQAAGIDKKRIPDIIKQISKSIIASDNIVGDIAQQEGVNEEQIQNVIQSQLPVVAEPEQNIEKTISLPSTVSIEDYEEVKKMWSKQYVEGEVPVTENVKNREEWIEKEVVLITNIINKLLSPNTELRNEGLDELGLIVPIFMINNLKGDEMLVYLKAKLEAAKEVKTDIEKEKEITERVKREMSEENKEFVKVKSKKKEEAKTMEVTAEGESKTTERMYTRDRDY